MAEFAPSSSKALAVNDLLNALPRRERRNVIKHCELVELALDQILYGPEQPIDYVYFPTAGFISLIATLDDANTLEVGLIGCEGMLGIPAVLGVPLSPTTAVVQGQGQALRIGVVSFQRVIQHNPGLQEHLQHYIQVVLTQLIRTTLCTAYHPLESRLARWLLMTHDRARDDNFYLKHSFLASLLGVHRSGVTIAAGALKQKGLIDYSRGHITILDRDGLEAVSCSCYRAMASMYKQLMH